MTTKNNLFKLTAFSSDSAGGNPAGVWVGDVRPGEAEMLSIAAEVGFSETAFISPSFGYERTIRFFSPEKEISFCGHATIASAVHLGNTNGLGRYEFETPVGVVPVEVSEKDGEVIATLTSVTPRQKDVSEELLSEVLTVIGWSRDDLDQSIPPIVAYAGAWHLVLATKDKALHDSLEYDFEQLKAIMLREELTTLQLIYRESDSVFHSRNPFPVGGVVEDPATGAAAAAFGGYLRDRSIVEAPATITLLQGIAMGRPSTITVGIPLQGGITVSGTAISIE